MFAVRFPAASHAHVREVMEKKHREKKITQQRDRRREAGKEGKIAWVMALRSPEC